MAYMTRGHHVRTLGCYTENDWRQFLPVLEERQVSNAVLQSYKERILLDKFCGQLEACSYLRRFDTEYNDIRRADLLRINSCIYAAGFLLVSFFQDQAVLFEVPGPFRFVIQEPEVKGWVYIARLVQLDGE